MNDEQRREFFKKKFTEEKDELLAQIKTLKDQLQKSTSDNLILKKENEILDQQRVTISSKTPIR